MTETIYGFAALLIAAMLTLMVQQSIHSADQETISMETEIMAHAVGSERMHFLTTKAFDARYSGEALGKLGSVLPSVEGRSIVVTARRHEEPMKQ